MASAKLAGMTASEPPFTTASPFLTTPQDLASIPSLVDEPLESRLEIYAYFLGSDSQRSARLFSSSAIPPALYPLCLVLRYLITKEHLRLGESSKRFNWSFKQVWAAVSSGCTAYTVHQALKSNPEATTLPAAGITRDVSASTLEPTTKDIHLQSSLQITLHSAWLLAQTLLLCPTPFDTPPSSLVQGPLFHELSLSKTQVTAESVLQDPNTTRLEKEVLQWVLDGTDEWLAIDVEALRKAKRERKKEEKRSQTSAAAKQAPQPKGGFGLLMLNDDDDNDEDD
ncbi:hypothetical protein BCV70DRAFT_9686 [Testicularia cyperi]|uniref:Uncharacterized protein n=1 Tax=Testicularia cyperi TaxID=1882483 RepID=A0A317XZ02_9BASI|nr:hypothetical protein BCV70DRAFT_9686 [Testicularia cyperi]